MKSSTVPTMNSKLSPRKKANNVVRKSDKFQKMYKPISWSSENFKKRLLHLKTPSGLERVVDWMDTNLHEQLEKNREETNNTSVATFFRYDYKVDETDMKKCDGSNSTVLKVKENNSSEFKPVPNELNCKPSASTKNIDRLCDSSKPLHQSRNGNLHFSPSSAERKKELCNYLQLMNHADKKEVCLSLYRRSSRVKNLEQKELAKKMKIKRINNECDEKSEKSLKSLLGELSSIGESLTLQSFNDLNMTIDTSKYPILQEKEDPQNLFNFIMPPSDVLNEFNDFQRWVEPILKQKNFKRVDKKNGTFKGIKVKSDMVEKEIINSENNCVDDIIENTSSPVKKQLELNKNQIGVIHNECMESRLKKMRRDRIDKNSVVKSKVSTTENKIPSTFNAGDEEEETIKNGGVNIRVDYDEGKSREFKPQAHNSGFSKRVVIVNENLFHGFSESEIRKSKDIDAKFNAYINKLSSIPKYVITKKISTKYKLNWDIPEPPDKSKLNLEPDANFDNSDEEMEEINSESDSASESLTSMESEISSESCSASLPDTEDLIKSPIQKCDMVSSTEICQRVKNIEPFNDKVEVQTLHSLLKKQLKRVPSLSTMNSNQDWDLDNSFCNKQKTEMSKNNSHFVSFEKENGSVLSAIYTDFYLILIQEFAVSLWNQTALGNVLGAHNLWVFNGSTKKLVLNKECIQKKSLEMVTSTETCVVYIELWTKEHKSDIRQGPVADIFAIVYFWIQKLNKMDKKVLQLENINGFADDVQYVVLKPSLNIFVSWHSLVDDNKVTQIRVYTLAADFQTIVNIRAMAKVEHYVSSLHNIEDCEELLMGCGEDRITLWNIEHGYIVASIMFSDIKLSLSTLWVKCDRGILFMVQQCVDKELRLIAINGRSHSWKRLKSYKPPEGYERIQNVYIENGVLISFYEEGILCWKAQSGEKIVEGNHNETDMEYFPSGKYLIITTEKNVFVGHALTHLLTVDD